MATRASERWHGRLSLGSGWAFFEGVAGENAPHAHHALQLCVATKGKLLIDVAGNRRSATAIALDADVPHRLVPDQGRVFLLYLEPASEVGRSVRAWMKGSASVEFPRPNLSAAESGVLREVILTSILGSAPAPPALDPAIDRVLQRLATSDLRTRPTLAGLAREASLSPSRFAARFRTTTSVAVRPYVLWLRLQRAVAAMNAGASVTEAAYVAGLSDSAHLARTFRRMFGTTLSASVARLAPGRDERT